MNEMFAKHREVYNSKTKPINNGYEYKLKPDTARKELRFLWDRQHAVDRAFRELPECPPIEFMDMFVEASMNMGKFNLNLWEKGKELQGKGHKVPYKAEYETAAGLWVIFRKAILREGRRVQAEQKRKRKID